MGAPIEGDDRMRWGTGVTIYAIIGDEPERYYISNSTGVIFLVPKLLLEHWPGLSQLTFRGRRKPVTWERNQME